MRAKQTIIVKKTHPKAGTRRGAEAVARQHADRIYTGRETATSWRFRQRPPMCFVGRSYKTDCLTKHVCVVYGRLRKSARARRACR